MSNFTMSYSEYSLWKDPFQNQKIMRLLESPKMFTTARVWINLVFKIWTLGKFNKKEKWQHFRKWPILSFYGQNQTQILISFLAAGLHYTTLQDFSNHLFFFLNHYISANFLHFSIGKKAPLPRHWDIFRTFEIIEIY